LSALLADDETPRARVPGLQAERTALSWNRTALAVFANALLALRSGWTDREAPVTALAVALLLAAGAAMIYGARRRKRLLDGRNPIEPPAIAVAMAAIVALVASVTGMASILMH
jgi:uncharacterized membrane protein YidH (DUF202 family)